MAGLSVNVSDSFAESIFDKPSLELNQSIKAGDVGGVEVGTIAIWTKPIVPDGWLECNGQTVDPVKYPELRKLMAAVLDYRGRFAQGASSDAEVGTKKEAGLPNIWEIIGGGESNYIGQTFWEAVLWADGAFKPSLNHKYMIRFISDGGSKDWQIKDIEFNAALSNPIYGNSTTVQPPSVIVKYIIKAN